MEKNTSCISEKHNRKKTLQFQEVRTMEKKKDLGIPRSIIYENLECATTEELDRHLNGTVRGRSAPSLTSGLWNSRPGREWMVCQQCSQ